MAIALDYSATVSLCPGLFRAHGGGAVRGVAWSGEFHGDNVGNKTWLAGKSRN